jgi:hypothetical protein
VLFALLTLAGCSQPTTSPPVTTTAVANPASAGGTGTNSKPATEEVWDAHYIGDDRVGHSLTTIQTHGEGQDQTIETTFYTQLSLKRGRDTVTQIVEIVSVEKPDGTPLSFSSTIKSGSSVMSESRGTWEDGALSIAVTTQGKTVKSAFPWKPEYRGPLADVQELQRHPLKPGETRTVKQLMPSLNQMGELELSAKEVEKTKLLDGEAELLRVEAVAKITTPLGVQKIASTNWVDEHGDVQKSYLPQLNQTSYRTTKEKATAPTTGGKFDLLEATIIKLNKPLDHPHTARSITYKATLPKTEIAGVFVSCPAQQVKLLDDHTCELTVRRIRPTEPQELEKPDEQPVKADLEPNPLVQSDDKRVVELAKSVASDEKDPWQIAIALEKLVHDKIKKKNFSQAFATAAEVARDLQGDCTEHAVLLAAACRARKIPARCAMGLVYYDPNGKTPSFAYHMWTEVWINDRWIPIDATLGRGGIGAGHIKLAHSNLDGADALTAFVPVFNVLGQLKLEVVKEE